MTFFTKEELHNLFKNFQVETIKELYEINEHRLLDHSYAIVARKL
jgi:hypothetical protein